MLDFADKLKFLIRYVDMLRKLQALNISDMTLAMCYNLIIDNKKLFYTWRNMQFLGSLELFTEIIQLTELYIEAGYPYDKFFGKN